MARASYRHGVRWIASNDNSGQGDSEEDIAGYISTLLLADLFDKDAEEVAKAIANERRKQGLEVG